MDKVKIGIPRAIPYYYFNDMWKLFFEKLGFEVIISPGTNKKILDDGINFTNDEMCLALKIYMGHINYLKDKCDYILIPRIEGYSINDQTCTNFLSLYDLVNNMFNVKILNYNIAIKDKNQDKKGMLKIGKRLGKSKKESEQAYIYAKTKSEKISKKKILNNLHKLSSNKLKILIVSHPYNIYDEYVGKPIIQKLTKSDIEVIYADRFNTKVTNILSRELSSTLYWKYNKELIGAIKLVEKKIDGIIFVSSFPCGPDSLVNELVIRRINKPYLNLIIDDLDALAGIETRIESFIDIIEQKEKVK